MSADHVSWKHPRCRHPKKQSCRQTALRAGRVSTDRLGSRVGEGGYFLSSPLFLASDFPPKKTVPYGVLGVRGVRCVCVCECVCMCVCNYCVIVAAPLITMTVTGAAGCTRCPSLFRASSTRTGSTGRASRCAAKVQRRRWLVICKLPSLSVARAISARCDGFQRPWPGARRCSASLDWALGWKRVARRGRWRQRQASVGRRTGEVGAECPAAVGGASF